MVTRIYTPPVMSYYRAQQIKHQEEDTSGQVTAEQSAAQANQRHQNPAQNTFESPTARPPQQDASQQQQQQSKLMLASAKQTQRIPMGTIIQDFTSTLNALGVDEPTKNEVSAYLGVVAMQAGKGNPDVGFIKQSLRTAAGTLDNYISDALQQPSNVVKDWVDALLLQPIDYHLDEQGKQQAAQLTVQARVAANDETTETAGEVPVVQEHAKLNAGQLQDIKDALQSSRTAYQSGDLDTAKTTLLNTQRQLPENSPATIQGRISLQLGKIAQEQYQYSNAEQHYQQAIEAFSKNPDAKGKLAQSYLGLAETYEAQGNWPQAQQSFEQSISLTQHLPNLGVQARIGLGNSLLQQNQPSQALEQFINAYQVAQINPGQTTELPDILSNMGRVYQELNQADKSEKAYRLALRYAKQDGNLDSYRATLVQLSSFYTQNENINGYNQVISRLKGLSG